MEVAARVEYCGAVINFRIGVPARPLVLLVEEIAPRPILLISSRDAPEPFMNRRLAERAGPGAQLWELPDTGHVGGIFAYPDEYGRRMVSFSMPRCPLTIDSALKWLVLCVSAALSAHNSCSPLPVLQIKKALLVSEEGLVSATSSNQRVRDSRCPGAGSS